MTSLFLFLLLSLLVAVTLTVKQSEDEILAEIKRQLDVQVHSVADSLSIDVKKLINLSGLKGLKKEIKKLAKVIVKSKKQLLNVMHQNQKQSKIQILQWAIKNAKETAGIYYYPKIEVEKHQSDNEHSILYVYKEYISTKGIKAILQNFMRQGISPGRICL